MKSPARRFVIVVLGLCTLLVGGTALLNYVVDPYDRYGNNRLGVYISAERETKATEVRRYPHNALLVGNSRMAMIPPKELKGFRFFNGAFAGATPEEVFWYVHHFARKQDLVVLGIDPAPTGPQPTKGDIFAPPGWESILENLISLQTLEYSLKTIFQHLAGKPSHVGPDGAFDNEGWVKRANREDSAFVTAEMENMKRIMESAALQNAEEMTRFHKTIEALHPWLPVVPPPFPQLTFYRRIAETLRERGITCVVVVPPAHEAIARSFDGTHVQRAFRAWVDELRALFPHVVDLSESTYGAAENFYPADPGHFKPETGVRFMNEAVLPVAKQALEAAGR
jgi:hypothetical protein